MGEPLAKSFIVRVYRRESARDPARRRYDGVELAGVVESADATQSLSFRSIEDLWAILGDGGRKSRRNRRS